MVVELYDKVRRELPAGGWELESKDRKAWLAKVGSMPIVVRWNREARTLELVDTDEVERQLQGLVTGLSEVA